MNKITVLCALACCANALYHLHLNLPDPCDIVLYTVATTKELKIDAFMHLHGSFQRTTMNVSVYGQPPVLT